MKIALFTDTYLPQLNGVATHVKTLKEGLEQIGHEVLVVTADPKAASYYIEDGVLRCPSAAIKRLYGYGVAPIYSVRRQHILDKYHFDIVHVHTEFSMGLSGIETARALQVPLIYTLHTMWEQYLHYIAPQAFLPLARKAERSYIRYFAGQADGIIGPSSRVQDFLTSLDIHRDVTIVPNAVELNYFSREQTDPQSIQALRKDYGFEPEDLVICFCGRLGKEKSVDVLLNFFASFHLRGDRIKFLIAGEGPMRADLEKQALDTGIADSVVFTGSVPHERMREIYACCDLYATASQSEVNSISMLEAMAMGLPVLHILDRNNPGQVKEGINGCTFRTADEFQQIVYHLRDNREALHHLRASTVTSVHSIGQEALADRVESVYLEHLNRHRRNSDRLSLHSL